MTDRSTHPALAVVDFNTLKPIECPCGLARRAFQADSDVPYTMHVTEIAEVAKAHFHKKLTETYFILEADREAYLELDGERVPVKPGMACKIVPNVVHRAVGRMKVLIVVSPKFDPADEFVVG